MQTAYADRTARSIRQETQARYDALKAQYGDRFQDVIIVSRFPDGVIGFRCDFRNAEATTGPGYTLQSFARAVFGAGTLKRIDDCRYAVIAK